MNKDEFLSFVDALRDRGAIHVQAGELAVQFAAPKPADDVAEEPGKPGKPQRVNLNESERDELDRLRAAQTRFEELGID